MLYEQIIAEREKLGKELQILTAKMQHYPDGELLCAKNGKYTKCYLLKCNGSKPVYIPKENRQFIENLAAKKYYSLRIHELTQEIKILDNCLSKYKKIKIKSPSLLEESSCYKKFLNPLFHSSSDALNQWLSSDYEHNPAHPEHLIYKTFSGQYVRSKSEVIIANSLYINRIPFRYECGITFDNISFYPDFTILHPKTLEIFYWEHFGMMDNYSYCDGAFNKLKVYSNHDILPGINLITTYETQKHPIDSDQIQKLINDYFPST